MNDKNDPSELKTDLVNTSSNESGRSIFCRFKISKSNQKSIARFTFEYH